MANKTKRSTNARGQQSITLSSTRQQDAVVIRQMFSETKHFTQAYRQAIQWRREGAKGGCAPDGTVHVATFEGAKIWNSEVGRCWRIGVCIADSDIFTPL